MPPGTLGGARLLLPDRRTKNAFTHMTLRRQAMRKTLQNVCSTDFDMEGSEPTLSGNRDSHRKNIWATTPRLGAADPSTRTHRPTNNAKGVGRHLPAGSEAIEGANFEVKR